MTKALFLGTVHEDATLGAAPLRAASCTPSEDADPYNPQEWRRAKKDQSFAAVQAYAVSPDGKHVAIATGVGYSDWPDARYQLSVLDMAGRRRLIAERDPVQGLRQAIPHFADSNSLELDSPSGQVHCWTYSAENDVWLESPSRPSTPYQLDRTKTPPTIDIVCTEGPDKRLVYAGICELDGDNVKFCFAPWGSLERPKGFDASAGSRRNLIVLKREKPAGGN